MTLLTLGVARAVVLRLDDGVRTCNEVGERHPASLSGAAGPRRGMLVSRPSSAYGEDMAARVGGRNRAITWIVGFLCAGIVGALVWLSLPAGPGLLYMVGQLLDGTVP